MIRISEQRCNARAAVVAMVLAALVLAGCSRSSAPDAGKRSADTPGTTRLAGLLGAEYSEFERVFEPREFEFPRDHGPHPDYRNEWWYVTGNLWSPEGARFGYELMLFRFSLSPGSLDGESAWRSNQLFVGHFAVSDAGERNMHVAERYARGALGLDVRVVPVFANQELDTAVRYREGAVDVDGRSGNRTVGGHGYVELTGYAEASRQRSGSE